MLEFAKHFASGQLKFDRIHGFGNVERSLAPDFLGDREFDSVKVTKQNCILARLEFVAKLHFMLSLITLAMPKYLFQVFGIGA